MAVLPRFQKRLLLVLMIVALCVAAWAQSENATISGTITDPTGAIVVGANVKLNNVQTGTAASSVSNNAGLYVFFNVRPGHYRITVDKSGFRQMVLTDLTVNVQDTLSRNFAMQMGVVGESVTVSGEATTVNTQSAAVSTVVDQTYVKNMPLNGRSFQDLILLTPGVVTQTPQLALSGTVTGGTGEFSVNGQRTESNNYVVDGVSGNIGSSYGSTNIINAGASGSVAASTALGTTQALVSVDALEEFKVQSSGYSAEYGRNPGGQFSFVTKSGTNQWHGSVFDYLRNGYFDAQDWFNNYLGQYDSGLRQNDFGGTFGGPIRKDKTFFFFSYEGLRLKSPQAAAPNYLVPDLCMRGVLSACTGSNTPAPAALQPALKAFPEPSPSGLNFGDGMAQYYGTWSNSNSINSTSVRLDHTIKDKTQLFFRFSQTGSYSYSRGGGTFSPSTNGVFSSTVRTYTAGVTSMLSNRLSNDFRLNQSSSDTPQKFFIDAIGGSVPVDLAAASGMGPQAQAALYLCYDSCSALFQFPQFGSQHQWNITDNVSLALGHHQLKLGVDYRRLSPTGIDSNPSMIYYFFSQSAVLSNSPMGFIGASVPKFPLYKNFSAFAQDEWKASRRLTLSMGLRWEVNPAPGVTQGMMPYTLQGSTIQTLTMAPKGTRLYPTTWSNFAPRLGMAYVLHDKQGWETVLHAGGGIYFDTGNQLSSLGYGGPGFGNSDMLFGSYGGTNWCNLGGTCASSPVGLVPSIRNPTAPYNGMTYFGHLQLPYTLQWNTDVQQALGKSQVFTLSYRGSHGYRLLSNEHVDISGNPSVGNFNFVKNDLSSDYNSLQAQFNRRLSRGLTALVAYTWSHCFDYGSFNNILGYQRGDCSFDVRQNLSAAFSYDLPTVGNSKLLNALLHHWGIDDRFTAHTAFPINIYGSEVMGPQGQWYHKGQDFVPGKPIYLYGAVCAQKLSSALGGKQCPGGKAINPAAFVETSSGFGNVPRNFLRMFGAWQMDIAARREFLVNEKLKVQFRAEAFNVFNHPNFGTVDTYTWDSTFGTATGTLASSLGVLSPLYQMGGARSMQFALRLEF